MDQSDIENNSGSETDEAAEICVEVAPPKKQKNEEWRLIKSKTDIYNKFHVQFDNDRKTNFRNCIKCGTVVKSMNYGTRSMNTQWNSWKKRDFQEDSNQTVNFVSIFESHWLQRSCAIGLPGLLSYIRSCSI